MNEEVKGGAQRRRLKGEFKGGAQRRRSKAEVECQGQMLRSNAKVERQGPGQGAERAQVVTVMTRRLTRRMAIYIKHYLHQKSFPVRYQFCIFELWN